MQPTNVWSVWLGTTPPPYIQTCLATCIAACRSDPRIRHHLVTDANLARYLPAGALHKSWADLPGYGLRCDCLRAALLAVYGGLYVDADTVVTKHLGALLDGEPDLAYSVWDKPPLRVLNGYLYARPGSPIAREWLRQVNEALKERRTGWTELGEHILTPLVEAAPPGTTQRWPRATFLPLDVDREVHKLFEPGKPADLYTLDTVAFGLNHSWMAHHKPAELKNAGTFGSDLMFHRLMYKARHDLSEQGIDPADVPAPPAYPKFPEVVKPKAPGQPRLLGLTVSVDYADKLAEGLPLWSDGMDRIVVATAERDQATLKLCEAFDNVEPYVTDRFWRPAPLAAFNKGGAMDGAVVALGWRPGDWVVCFDADVVPPGDWRQRLEAAGLQRGNVYGCRRVLPDGTGAGDTDVVGFFMCFAADDEALATRPWFGDWHNASGYDTAFVGRWPTTRQVLLDLELSHAGRPGANWCGAGNEAKVREMEAERKRRGGWKHERLDVAASVPPAKKKRK